MPDMKNQRCCTFLLRELCGMWILRIHTLTIVSTVRHASPDALDGRIERKRHQLAHLPRQKFPIPGSLRAGRQSVRAIERDYNEKIPSPPSPHGSILRVGRREKDRARPTRTTARARSHINCLMRRFAGSTPTRRCESRHSTAREHLSDIAARAIRHAH